MKLTSEETDMVQQMVHDGELVLLPGRAIRRLPIALTCIKRILAERAIGQPLTSEELATIRRMTRDVWGLDGDNVPVRQLAIALTYVETILTGRSMEQAP